MKLLFENWRKYMNEADLDDDGDVDVHDVLQVAQAAAGEDPGALGKERSARLSKEADDHIGEVGRYEDPYGGDMKVCTSGNYCTLEDIDIEAFSNALKFLKSVGGRGEGDHWDTLLDAFEEDEYNRVRSDDLLGALIDVRKGEVNI